MYPRILITFFMVTLNCAATSYLWLEKPQRTNFNITCRWSVLSEKSAAANIPNKQRPPKSKAFAEYDFDVDGPGGAYSIWGRSFDPVWSSPARWRVDDQPWQDWKPGKCVDRVVFQKSFPIQWHKWGELKLKPGKHTIRFECTANRRQGNYPYTILDALLLTKGNFIPKGTWSPADIVFRKITEIRLSANGLPNAGEYINKAEILGKEALVSDLGLLTEFSDLNKQIKLAQSVNKQLSLNGRQILSGRMKELSINDQGYINIKSKWSAPVAGKMCISFSRNGVLYSAVMRNCEKGAVQTFKFKLPKNLPEGKIFIQCIPIGQPLYTSARKNIYIGPGFAARKPVARSWGVYRDSSGNAHFWMVNDCNMMFWDGAPFIPFGGMINSPLSWGSRAGNKVGNKRIEEFLRSEFKALGARGIRDIYFNGFFLKANPGNLARMVAIAEECGMTYGLHPSTVNYNTDMGFARITKEVVIKSGKSSSSLDFSLRSGSYVPGKRLIWFAVNSRGDLVECRIINGVTPLNGVARDSVKAKIVARMRGRKRSDFLRIDRKYFSIPIKLSKPSGNNDYIVKCIVERFLDTREPANYLGTINEQIERYRETYGAIKFGPGMRMWVDPFNNEMHHNPNSVNYTGLYRKRLSSWLLNRYGTLQNLRRNWGNDRKPYLDSFYTAASLVPLYENMAKSYWVNPETRIKYVFSAKRSQALRDSKVFSGIIAEEMISKAADALKKIANVPVILKHNCWFSDWFINPAKAGGQDGMGYEAYCYGDSLAYHNTLTAYAQVIQSARKQWAVVTESSAAAFEGQKKYGGYLDRLQMMYDIDQLMKFGAKGFYHFGFSFAGNPRFDTTDLLRDIRQIEWLKTHADTYYASAERLAKYHPEVYGWYPAYLREYQIIRKGPRDYEMDGHYTAVTTQIRQAPDGRWIIPAITPNADWYGLLVGEDLLRRLQVNKLLESVPTSNYPVYLLRSTPGNEDIDGKFPVAWKRFPLNGFTSQGIGVVPAKRGVITLKDFQKKILGYQVFQTYDVNGRTMPDGSLMVWTCSELKSAKLQLPAGAEVTDISGKPVHGVAGSGQMVIDLRKPPYEKNTNKKDFPEYIFGGRYFYPDHGQPEVALIKGVTVKKIIELNRSVEERWFPEGVNAKQVKYWQEAENFTDTTFTQPLLEGFSRYSKGSAIGINTHFDPPAGKHFLARYKVNIPSIRKPFFWLRRMYPSSKFFSVKLRIDGKDVGTLSGKNNLMHLNPWSAGLSRNNLKVGWSKISCPPINAGEHVIDLVVENNSRKAGEDNIDITLMGDQAAADVGKGARSKNLRYLQLDCWMLTE